MQRILLLIILIFLTAWPGISQKHRITPVFKQTDTCLALQVMQQTLPFSVSETGFLYLMDDFKCIEADIFTFDSYDEKKHEFFNWISFPRLESEFVKTGDLFGKNNITPDGFPDTYLNSSYLINNPLKAKSNVIISCVYNGVDWSNIADLIYVNRTDGYKFSLKYYRKPEQPVRLCLHGKRVDTSQTVDLMPAPKQNWLGYWLYEEQDIFNALGSAAGKIKMIKHQNWVCVKTDNIFSGTGPVNTKTTWHCDKKTTNIRYGDMVILYADTAVCNFRWKRGKAQQPDNTENDTGYFTVETTKNYKPVIVELKSNDHPREIGAFRNNTCVGAVKLSGNDSVVVIRAFSTAGKTGELTFRKYYGDKTENPLPVDEYYVYNQRRKIWERGRATNNFYDYLSFVSFKENKEKLNAGKNSFELQVFVSRNKKTLTVNYRLPDESEVTLAIFNAKGKKMMESFTKQTKGKHQSRIDIQNLKSGIYQFILSAANQTAVKRFVILQ